MRKAARKHGLPVYAIAPFASHGLEKMWGRVIKTVPGAEASALEQLPGEVGNCCAGRRGDHGGRATSHRAGGLSAAARLADATGARLAWVPRRAGERGALEAGALPNLLPGGRPTAVPGRDTAGILAAAGDGSLDALLIGGMDPGDLADPDAVLAALDRVTFLVSLELRHSDVTQRADVVFPVARQQRSRGPTSTGRPPTQLRCRTVE
ncbi:putative nADH-quinone oxidoreductase [Mycobacterium xenopi 3993]|nr:putative nADH-quinone oxidoreductase [Mycobacterium xenopi 3993]